MDTSEKLSDEQITEALEKSGLSTAGVVLAEDHWQIGNSQGTRRMPLEHFIQFVSDHVKMHRPRNAGILPAAEIKAEAPVPEKSEEPPPEPNNDSVPPIEDTLEKPKESEE